MNMMNIIKLLYLPIYMTFIFRMLKSRNVDKSFDFDDKILIFTAVDRTA